MQEPLVQPDLENNPGVAAAMIEVRHFVLHRQYCPHRVGGIVERRHHRVADGLDDEAVVTLHPLRQISEMIAHETIGGGIAKLIVEFGRALQIGEHDGDAADFDIIAGTQKLFGTQASKCRHRDDAFSGKRIASPIALLDGEDTRQVGVVVNDEFVLVARRRQ